MDGLEISRLRKDFDDILVVDGIDLSVRAGEFVSLLGPSGCGKTTTLRMIAGLLNPSSGTVELDGRTLSRDSTLLVPPERRNMSMIFQSYAVWPHKKVFDNVAYGVRLRKLPAAETKRRVLAALEVVKMAHLADRYPGQLSGGQQQRVGLARALAVEPRVLLMDEPLSNLDASLREEMRFEIRRIHDEFKITTVYVTHDISEAIVASDRIALMNGGRIEQIGSPEELYENPRTAFAAGFIGPVNLLPATAAGPDAVELSECPETLRLPADSTISAGAKVTIAFRPHDATLTATGTAVRGDHNMLHGTVARQAYIGHARDYVLRLATSDRTIRVITPPSTNFAPGEAVSVTIPIPRCRLVSDDGRP
ncbi:MAG: ATP-binding cassette domain-containing protein [Actinophytocola sp.]|uniref:ABC transporter ATP-binding protein n=1 Tax=Actinophytocola sp. TaxID=1872138 RepID=UPI0013209022|nr:ABC transporter ATP-binding protein [Actinophytocola sp.]MPZ79701.1 ATP-binding cassette domain-containing protein [Actinophytocola sp.]